MIFLQDDREGASGSKQSSKDSELPWYNHWVPLEAFF